MTTITITAETIAKLEAAGFNRWQKNGMDRLYVNADTLGLEVAVSRNGKAKSEGIWCGTEVYKQEATEILQSKTWIDVATGELHVKSDFVPGYGEPTVEEAAAAYISSVLGEAEPEATEDKPEVVSEYIELLDENEDTGETLYAVRVLTGDVVSVIVDAEGTEWFNDDWQSAQPKSFAEVADWRWYRGEEIDF